MMGKFITDKARIEQTDNRGLWQTIDNQLYKDDDGTIYLVPRYFKTDNYTIPDCVAWICGDSATWDVRPSHFHDVGCEYHQMIKVRITEENLRRARYLRVKNNKLVCENIPKQLLEIVPVTKGEINDMFGRMLKSSGAIPKKAQMILRTGVAFNFGWYSSGKTSINLDKLYINNITGVK